MRLNLIDVRSDALLHFTLFYFICMLLKIVLRSDVLLFFTLFYFNTFTLAMFNYLIVLSIVEFE